MAEVRLSVAAVEDLDRMILTHSLPYDTRVRVKRTLRVLERFPRVGRQLEGRWSPFRFILGPWRWLVLLYTYDQQRDLIVVVSIQDARSSSAVASL